MWIALVISLGIVDATYVEHDSRESGHDGGGETGYVEKDEKAGIPFERILMSALDTVEGGRFFVLVHGGVLDVVLLARGGEFKGLPHEDEPVHDGDKNN